MTVNTTTISAALSEFSLKKPDLAVCAVPSNEAPTNWISEISANYSKFSDIRIVLLTDDFNEDTLHQAAATGISAVLSYNITAEVFQRSLELVALGQQLFPSAPNAVTKPSAELIPFHRPMVSRAFGSERVVRPIPVNNSLTVTRQQSHTERGCTLSRREQQILDCLVEGAANKTIARNLEITEATVKVHIKGLLRKINVSNRTQAAIWGLNNKLPLDQPKSALHETGGRALSSEQLGS